MKNICALIALLFLPCSMNAMLTLSTTITFGGQTKELYTWISQERKHLFGKTYFFLYNSDEQKITKVSRVRKITKKQVADITNGLCAYTPTIKTDRKLIRVSADTIMSISVDIGAIIDQTGTSMVDSTTLIAAALQFALDKIIDDKDIKKKELDESYEEIAYENEVIDN
jgi:hypothetical protein